MTETVEKPAFVRPFVMSVGVVLLAMAGFAIARETGLVSPDFGKRGAAAMLGLMLSVCGNILPKIARRLELGRETAAAYASADRLAGWALVVGGLAYAGVWAFAPIERAPLGSSCVGLGAVLLALGLWLSKARPTANYALPALLMSTAIAGRLTIFMLIFSLMLAGALIQIDAIWGDTVAQWSAVILSVMLPAVGIAGLVWAKARGQA